MFINVVYKDAPELSSTMRRPSTEPDPSQEKTLLVNPKCPVRVMLEYIRKQCKLGSYTSFDLCDESGFLLGLFSLDTFAYATDRFEHKKTYYVIVLKKESEREMTVLPQLNQENRFYSELQQRVKTYLSTHPTPNGSKSSKLSVKTPSPPARSKSTVSSKRKVK